MNAKMQFRCRMVTGPRAAAEKGRESQIHCGTSNNAICKLRSCIAMFLQSDPSRNPWQHLKCGTLAMYFNRFLFLLAESQNSAGQTDSAGRAKT